VHNTSLSIGWSNGAVRQDSQGVRAAFTKALPSFLLSHPIHLLWYGFEQWAGLVVPKSSSAKSSRRDSSRTKAVVKIPRA